MTTNDALSQRILLEEVSFADRHVIGVHNSSFKSFKLLVSSNHSWGYAECIG